VGAEEGTVEAAAVRLVVVTQAFWVDGGKAKLSFECVFVGNVGEDFDELRRVSWEMLVCLKRY
jgi:hypothetical protein